MSRYERVANPKPRIKNFEADDWDPDDVKTLRRCRAQKRTLADIAKLLKNKSRCAVAGKCHRLGI